MAVEMMRRWQLLVQPDPVCALFYRSRTLQKCFRIDGTPDEFLMAGEVSRTPIGKFAEAYIYTENKIRMN